MDVPHHSGALRKDLTMLLTLDPVVSVEQWVQREAEGLANLIAFLMRRYAVQENPY